VEDKLPAEASPIAAEQGNTKAQRRGRRMLWLVLLVCASPLIASYFTYYVLKPEQRNNYGTLVDQRAHPVPAGLATTTLDGRAQPLADFKGKWVMLMAAPGACADACQKQLFAMRQLRLMQGKEMDRIERVWLITDREPLDTIIIREYDGTHMLRADPAAVRQWLPADLGTTPANHIYMIDPLGHLMMRFPQDPEPRKVYKDIYKLLKASSIG
jgi:peroxiredoxin